MRILAIDIGTGTQDVLFYDSQLSVENAFKMVIPSPTMMLRKKIQSATKAQSKLILTGVTMGGGPCVWAIEDHLKAGLKVFATPDAARTLNDDLEMVQSLGVKIISEDEVKGLSNNSAVLKLRDFDFDGLHQTFSFYGVDIAQVDAIAVAVFDHGAAPPGISDRQFRFDYLAKRVHAENQLTTFSFPADQIPVEMTRLQAVAYDKDLLPAHLVVMDSAPAAVLGASFDPLAQRHPEKIFVNVGNFHTIAFRLERDAITGIFEHHTGFLNTEKLDRLIQSLADGSLQHEDVFDDEGHGAMLLRTAAIPISENSVIVTGPRRSMLRKSQWKPYFAVPFGDMMLSGCYGLVAAVAAHDSEHRDLILSSLGDINNGTAPWDAL